MVITNPFSKEKIFFRSFHLFPKFSIIDPSLSVTVPPDKTCEGGIDIISHVLEPYLTNTDTNTPLQERFQESIIITVMENLPIAMKEPGNLEARANLAWSAVVAVSGFPNSGESAGFPMHAIEQPISAIFDIPHGRGLAALIPSFIETIMEINPLKLAKLAERVFNVRKGNEKQKAKETVKKMVEWLDKIGILVRLRDLGVDEKSFPKIAEDSIRISGMGKEYLSNFKQLDKEGILNILKGAY